MMILNVFGKETKTFRTDSRPVLKHPVQVAFLLLIMSTAPDNDEVR